MALRDGQAGRRRRPPPRPDTAALLASERWLDDLPRPQGPLRVLLAYPCPYPVAAASLGYQTVFRLLSAYPALDVDRAWLQHGSRPDPRGLRGARTGRPASDFHVIAVSLAWELELPGLIALLQSAGLPALAQQRSEDAPTVLLGGPITCASARFVHPFIDALLVGEAEGVLDGLVERLVSSGGHKPALLEALGDLPGLMVPDAAGGRPEPPPERAPAQTLPARAAWTSPHSSFADMYLVEAGRGCLRACTYCVLRAESCGGLRPAPAARVLESIPPWAKRVGLVGAAVTDHPQLDELLQACVDRGLEVGLSSLRASRLNEHRLSLLRAAGLKTLTTALDGASERLRKTLQRGTRADDVIRAVTLARAQRVLRVKLYLMIGLPGESVADIDECVALCRTLSGLLPLTLTVSPFVPKARTPLAQAPFADLKLLREHVKRLQRGLAGKATMQPVSVGWAWVEARLAAGDEDTGRAALEAVAAGSSLAAWRRALPERG